MNNIILKCNCCQKEIEKYKPEYDRQIKNGKINFYCSLSCSSKSQMCFARKKRKEQYELNSKKCLECNNSLTYQQKNYTYCSSSCRTKHFHKSGIFSNLKHGKFAVKPCKICGVFTKFICCSKMCESENDKLLRIEKLKSGNYSSKPYSGRNTLKRALVDIRGYKCEECELNMWRNEKLPLTIHHIDGDATHNVLNNLKLLCWNCHSITPNFSRKNQGSTRNYRYKTKEKSS